MGDERELEHCDDCGKPYAIWSTDNDLWNEITDHPAGLMICPRCFGMRAEARDRHEIWHLTILERRLPSIDSPGKWERDLSESRESGEWEEMP